MARTLFINADPSTQSRATTLGCGWMPTVPPEFASIASAPCVILSGAGITTVLPEPTTKAAVAAALQPILNAETALAQAAISKSNNRDAVIAKAKAALGANATFLALPSPTNAQVIAQVQRLTKEVNALIHDFLDDFTDVSDT